jgi:hypothetical protein
MTLAIGLSYIAFIMLKCIPSIPFFIRAFIMKWCCILLMVFPVYADDLVVFSLLLLMCCITFKDLHILHLPCIPWKKLTWLWCMIFPQGCWIQFAIILLRIFTSMFIKEIGP